MRNLSLRLGVIFTILSATFTWGTTLYVDANNSNPTPPYSDWSTAATNIQDAIDASSAGDQILVTNGVYQSGGKAMAGTLTNRVALDKAITVQSVNGPFATIIEGAGATNGNAAIRCAWLTNNASLVGFTLTWGATQTGGDAASLQSGGGVWCASSNSIVQSCIVISNTASFYGGGIYRGNVQSSLVSSNGIQIGATGGTVYSAILNNCTVVSNTATGIVLCQATNSIVYYNNTLSGNGNYSGGTLSHCCTIPSASGTGNFTNAPQLFADGIHLSTASPCIGAGTTAVSNSDIFGTPWANPPSVGCAEAAGAPLITQPQVQLTSSPVGFIIGNAQLTGARPFTYAWLKDGAVLQDNGHHAGSQTANLIATGVTFDDAGGYQLIASNSSGAATSAVAQVVIHCVDAAGTNPTTPYTNWLTAATNIQDAIAASATNEIVLVTNGVYATGGKSMDNLITNRVSIDKAILVQSVNGPNSTIVQGVWDPASTNGPAAVRCVWMTNNSILSGFTLQGGATRAAAFSFNPSMAGGGVLASSNNAVIYNCTITLNSASYFGAGAYLATLNNCLITKNHLIGLTSITAHGAGAERCALENCSVTFNVADQGIGGGADNCNSTNCAFIGNSAVDGGAINSGKLMNCTVMDNISTGNDGQASAALTATFFNCILYANTNFNGIPPNSVSCTFSYCDTHPLPSGTGNINVDPQVLSDSIHLSPTSPCIGVGTTNGLSGTDIDGQAWSTPPSIGCDEWQPAPVIALQPVFHADMPSRRALGFRASAAGQEPFSYFWTKDGTLIPNNDHYGNLTTPSPLVADFGPADAGSYQLVVTNAFGAVTSAVAQVVIHCVDAAGVNPTAPYTNWLTAATNIQNAIDAASAGEIILATNGIYSNGGKAVNGTVTNRVALNKSVTLASVNGYASTVIQGQWDPGATNGPGSIRCAWIGDGARVSGFTLRNGSCSGNSNDQYGGGALLSSNGVISDCVLSNNVAAAGGGGVAFGTAEDCFLTYNTAQNGGGAYQSRLYNCTLRENHCFASDAGAGVDTCHSYNCIIAENYATIPFQLANYPFSSNDKFTNCCTSPLPSQGSGNISSDPVFFDTASFRLAPASPCRGAGNLLYANVSDLDDEPFLIPPSIGCDEIIDANLTGPLSFTFPQPWTNFVVNHFYTINSVIQGYPSEIQWSFGDGTITTNLGSFGRHTWTNPGAYTVSLTLYNHDNPSGVSSNILVTVEPLLSPALQSAGIVSNSFQFSFLSQFSDDYVVQYTTNLTAPVTWQTLQNILFTTGQVINIQDTSITNDARFYRVQPQ